MKIRLRISLVFVLVAAAFFIFNHFYVLQKMTDDAKERVENNLKQSFDSFASSQSTREKLSFRRIQEVYTNEKIIKGVVASEEELAKDLEAMKKGDLAKKDARHNYLFITLHQVEAGMSESVLILNEKGVELVASFDSNKRENDYSAHPLIKSCLNDRPGEDVWNEKKFGIAGSPFLVSCYPIKYSGEIKGAVLYVRPMSTEYLLSVKAVSVSDKTVAVAYWAQDGLLASTLLPGQHNSLKTEIAKMQPELNKLFAGIGDEDGRRFDKQAVRDVVLGDKVYKALPATSPFNYEGKKIVGLMFLYSWTDAYKTIGDLVVANLAFSLIVLLLGVILGLAAVQQAYKTMDFILEGANKINLGNTEFLFTSENKYLQQLADTLNMMNGVMSGKIMPSSEEEALKMTSASGGSHKPAGAARGSSAMDVAHEDANGSGPIPASQSVSSGVPEVEPEQKIETPKSTEPQDEDKEEYYAKLFANFIKAKVECGEDVSSVSKERFIEKLKTTEEKLIEKHGCKGVKFDIKVKNNKVTLVPEIYN